MVEVCNHLLSYLCIELDVQLFFVVEAHGLIALCQQTPILQLHMIFESRLDYSILLGVS